MIGLLLLGFLGVLLSSTWLLMRKVATLNARWQYCIATPLVGLILLALIQLFSRYSLASAWGPLVIPAAACFAVVTLMFMLWQTNRKAFYVSLVVTFSFVAGGCLSWFVILVTFLGDASAIQAAEGRISQIASYRIVQNLSIWGGAPPTYSYEIYENPRSLPFVWRKVADGDVPCGNGLDADSVLIEPGTDDHMVLVSCRKPEPGFSPIHIPISQ